MLGQGLAWELLEVIGHVHVCDVCIERCWGGLLLSACIGVRLRLSAAAYSFAHVLFDHAYYWAKVRVHGMWCILIDVVCVIYGDLFTR